ncbi:MAG: efflux RND transporter periplasmic adaptor subunit [Lutispora sp.]
MNTSEIKKPILDRKKRILDLAKVFFGVIIFFTFFSKSFYSWTLPKVRTETISSGSLAKEITGNGIITAKERIEHYVSVRAQVKDIRVSVGDEVKKGDVIMVIDKGDLEKELERNNIELLELKLQYDRLVSHRDSYLVKDYEKRMKELEDDIYYKEKDYLLYKELYEKGLESRYNYELKEKDYNYAKSKLESLKEELEREMENSSRDIEAAKLDIIKKELDIRDIEEDIKNCIIVAPSDGIVKEINFKKGMMAHDSVPAYVMDNMKNGFEMKVDLNSELCKYISLGDQVEIRIKNQGNKVIDGEIKAISDKQNDYRIKTVTVELEDADLSGGEAGELYLRKKVGSYDVIVPRSAVKKDSQGEFVYVLEEKEGPLGVEYYVLRKSVTIGDSDNNYVGLRSGLLGNETVVVYSNKSLDDGCQVILEK